MALLGGFQAPTQIPVKQIQSENMVKDSRIDDVVEKLLSTASSATGFIPGLSRWICREGAAFRVLLLEAQQQGFYQGMFLWKLDEIGTNKDYTWQEIS